VHGISSQGGSDGQPRKTHRKPEDDEYHEDEGEDEEYSDVDEDSHEGRKSFDNAEYG
jgi:hypothetical protein